MFIILLLVIAFAAVAIGFKYFHKHDQEIQFGIPVSKPTFGTPTIFDANKCKARKDTVKVIVTYNDGTKETFVNEDGEIDVTDGGLVTIRPDEEHCITISPFSFRKIEEIHE